MKTYIITNVTPKGYISAYALDGCTINGLCRDSVAVDDTVALHYRAKSGVNILRKIVS